MSPSNEEVLTRGGQLCKAPSFKADRSPKRFDGHQQDVLAECSQNVVHHLEPSLYGVVDGGRTPSCPVSRRSIHGVEYDTGYRYQLFRLSLDSLNECP